MLDCLCFRGLVNRDVKKSDRFGVELTVPVNLLLFSGASIGSAADIWVKGGGTGDSDSTRLSVGQ